MHYKRQNQPNKGKQLWRSTELPSAATLLRSFSTFLQPLLSSLHLGLPLESYQTTATATATAVSVIPLATVSTTATANEAARLTQ